MLEQIAIKIEPDIMLVDEMTIDLDLMAFHDGQKELIEVLRATAESLK